MIKANRKIIIVGGGFGGLAAALRLQKHSQFDITLISDGEYFEYHAALYRSATGWSPNEVMVPITDILDSRSYVKVVQAKVESIDSSRKKIFDTIGNSYHYDDLILALGQVTNYFGIEGMSEASFGLNTIDQAIRLRQHLKEEVLKPEQEGAMEFVIVGGGATGVELASELHFFIEELCIENGVKPRRAKVLLLEASSRLLSILSPKVSHYALERLQELGVEVRLSAEVQSLKGDELFIKDSDPVKTQTVIWTAGASNNPFYKSHDIFKLAKNGRVEVDEYMSAAKNIYVIGDNANTQYAGMAQTALFDARFVVDNLVRASSGKKLKMYVPHRPIYAIPVGRNFAIVQWSNLVISARFGWILRRIADLRLFMSFEPYRKAIKTWRSGTRKARGFNPKKSQ